jgi:hypothetical protein
MARAKKASHSTLGLLAIGSAVAVASLPETGLLWVPLGLLGCYWGMKRTAVYRCDLCQAETPRNLRWYEWG